MKRLLALLLCLLLMAGCAQRNPPMSSDNKNSGGALEPPTQSPQPSLTENAQPQSGEDQPVGNQAAAASSSQQPTGTPDQPYLLKFSDLLDENYEVSPLMKSLAGQTVTMTGFMALQSPLDGSFVYLTNLPLVVCPYCAPETDTPIYTMAVYPKSGKPIEFSTEAVTVTGTLVLTDTQNEFGHTTPFHLEATSIKPSSQLQLSTPLREYSVLAQEGLTIDALNMIDELLNITAYYVPIYEQAPVKLTPVAEIDRLINRVRSYNFSISPDLIEILTRLRDLQSKVNEMVGAGQIEETSIYADECLKLWEDYQLWGASLAESQ